MSKARSPKFAGEIVFDPKIAFGKPVLAGTRIAASQIIEFLAAGWEPKRLLREYPQLTLKDVQAAAHYANLPPEEHSLANL